MLLPRTIKKLLGVFRGKVTPLFVFLSTALGFWFGLMPGFSGLHLLLLAVVLILNVNIGLFVIFGALGTAVSLAAAPALYHVGLALHSWLRPLLWVLANLPIIGFTNFDRYALAGGIILGPAIGAALGLILLWLVIQFRHKMVTLERKSPAFKKWYAKRWVRILDRILIGKRTADMESLFTSKKKLIRLPGLIIVVVLFGLIGVLLPMLSDTVVKDRTTTAMSWANNAEVNLERLRLSPMTGQVSLQGLQMTDPENLDTNRLVVGTMTAQAGVYNLLKGEIVLRNVELDTVAFDRPRETPGRRYERPVDKKPAPERPDIDLKTLEDYIAQAEKLYEWFETLSRWMPARPAETTGPREEPVRFGDYLNAVAAVPASPRVLARHVRLRDVALPVADFGTTLITLENVSDAPYAARLPVRVDMVSEDSEAALNAVWDFSVRENAPAVNGTFAGVDVSALTEGLGAIAGLRFSEGIAAGEFGGHLSADYIDMAIDVTLSQLTAAGDGDGVFGLGAADTTEIFSAIDQISLLLRIVGPTQRPQVTVDAEQFMAQLQEAMIEAGKQQLLRRVQDQLPDELKELDLDDLTEPDRIIEGIRGLFDR